MNKGIRIDAEGDASLEDLDKVANEAAEIEPSPDPEKPKSNHKKVIGISENISAEDCLSSCSWRLSLLEG